MKILMIIPSLSKNWGGTTTSVINFYKGLSRQTNTDCTVVTTVLKGRDDEIDDEILENDDFILFPTKSASWYYSKELNIYLKKSISSFDFVWIHTLWTSTTYFGAKYANMFRVPYQITPHGMIEPDALKRKALKKRIYWSMIEKSVFDNAVAIHCITEAEAAYTKRLTRTKAYVIPNCIEEEPFLMKEYGDLTSICFIGRFHEKKALDLLLRAVEKIDDIRLIVAGSGEEEYEALIYDLVRELKIEDRVEFKGFVDKSAKREMFRECSFLVLPSFTEGLSMVGLESVMNSTPVLTTRKCNFDEVIQYDAGIVMEDNEPETIKTHILKMLESDIVGMSEHAYLLAIKEYSMDSVSLQMLDKIKRIVSS